MSFAATPRHRRLHFVGVKSWFRAATFFVVQLKENHDQPCQFLEKEEEEKW